MDELVLPYENTVSSSFFCKFRFCHWCFMCRCAPSSYFASGSLGFILFYFCKFSSLLRLQRLPDWKKTSEVNPTAQDYRKLKPHPTFAFSSSCDRTVEITPKLRHLPPFLPKRRRIDHKGLQRGLRPPMWPPLSPPALILPEGNSHIAPQRLLLHPEASNPFYSCCWSDHIHGSLDHFLLKTHLSPEPSWCFILFSSNSPNPCNFVRLNQHPLVQSNWLKFILSVFLHVSAFFSIYH